MRQRIIYKILHRKSIKSNQSATQKIIPRNSVHLTLEWNVLVRKKWDEVPFLTSFSLFLPPPKKKKQIREAEVTQSFNKVAPYATQLWSMPPDPSRNWYRFLRGKWSDWRRSPSWEWVLAWGPGGMWEGCKSWWDPVELEDERNTKALRLYDVSIANSRGELTVYIEWVKAR